MSKEKVSSNVYKKTLMYNMSVHQQSRIQRKGYNTTLSYNSVNEEDQILEKQN